MRGVFSQHSLAQSLRQIELRIVVTSHLGGERNHAFDEQLLGCLGVELLVSLGEIGNSGASEDIDYADVPYLQQPSIHSIKLIDRDWGRPVEPVGIEDRVEQLLDRGVRLARRVAALVG